MRGTPRSLKAPGFYLRRFLVTAVCALNLSALVGCTAPMNTYLDANFNQNELDKIIFRVALINSSERMRARVREYLDNTFGQKTTPVITEFLREMGAACKVNSAEVNCDLYRYTVQRFSVPGVAPTVGRSEWFINIRKSAKGNFDVRVRLIQGQGGVQ